MLRKEREKFRQRISREKNMKRVVAKHCFGDMEVWYVEEEGAGTCGLMLFPAKLEEKVSLEGDWQTDSLVQVKLAGDPYPGCFSGGMTMRGGSTVQALRFVEQRLGQEVTAGTVWHRLGQEPAEPMAGQRKASVIETVLEGGGLRVLHRLKYQEETSYFIMETEVTNLRAHKVTLEMLSSFSLCGLSPFGKEERTSDMSLYRLRSKWSAEGRLVREGFAELEMEPSWSRYGVQSHRFGQVGTMPVRGYFPWAAVEDARYGVMTGAQIYHNGSWQMELYGRDDRAALSGGLADREFGHWMKELLPKESFRTPQAVVSTCVGGVDEISARLTSAQKEGRRRVPAREQELPVLFNEYCTTWGNPTEENLLKIVDTIRGRGFAYCVIDAGWYSIGDGGWGCDMGDWNINQTRFPGGFERTVAAIRDAGMIPGLWFEMETVGPNAEGFQKEEWLLKRDGVPLEVGVRRFWDLRKPEVVDYLSEKVIGLLKKYGFGYLKVDYNDHIGIGCDGAESLGEGLRQCAEAAKSFFRKIREELPDLVIENCSSGGHRLEPSMQAVSSMASFSDAHECAHIPVVAANVHRAILPEQSQIWAVLHSGDDDKRLFYSMVNTFLGRMCISGDIYGLDEEQWRIVEKGLAFYRAAAPVIRDGFSRRYGNESLDYNHLEGWQIVFRTGEQAGDGLALAVIHRFGSDAQGEEGVVPAALADVDGEWELDTVYSRPQVKVVLERQESGILLSAAGMEEMEAAAVLLRRTEISLQGTI